MNQKSKVVTFVKLLAAGYGITVVLLLGVTFLLYRFQLGEGQTGIFVTVIYVLSCFLGGFLTGKAWKRKRLLLGLMYGILYSSVLICRRAVSGLGKYA